MTKAAAKNRKVQPQISNAKKAKVSGEKAPILPIEKQNLIIKNVFDRLDGRSVILHGIEKTKSDLMSNLSCAVKDHRGNSSILIGPRASGKTTLVKQLTEKITLEHGKTHQIENLTLQGAIFSETQSVLKFLLANIKTIVNGATSVIEDEPTEDLSEYLAFDQLSALVKQFFLPNLKVTKKRFIIFVLEDLEKFAAHPQQNLLYCLFELALTLPVFVIGTSCRIDVLELLEKRVKSRFSQNIIYLPLPDSLENFIERIKVNLLVEDDEEEIYNKAIDEFVNTNQNFSSFCNFHFDFTKDVRPIFRQLSLTFSSIHQTGSPFYWNTFSDLFDTIVGPSRQELTLNPLILETTIVELMIIVSMCRLVAKFTSIPVTFDVMSEELKTCKLRAPGLEHFVWKRSTLQVAFDRLINCRLLLITNYSPASSYSWTDRSYLTVRLGLPLFVILDAIEKHSYNSKEIFALACEKF